MFQEINNSKTVGPLNTLFFTSLRIHETEDKKYELWIYTKNGSKEIESFDSLDEAEQRKSVFTSSGSYTEIGNVSYNLMHVSSLEKQDIILDDGSNQYRVILNRASLGVDSYRPYKSFDNESDRDNYYDTLLTMGIGSGGGGTIIQQGDAKLKKEIISNADCGAAKAGTKFPEGQSFQSFAETLLRRDVAPTISTSFSGAGIKEVGTVVNGSTIILNITNPAAMTIKPTQIKFYVGSTLLETKNYIEGTNQYRYEYNKPITSNTTLKAELTYTGNKTVSGTGTFEFIYAKWVGVTRSDLDATNISAFIATASKDLSKGRAKTWSNITLNDERFVYMYPKSYGMLTDIKDGNGFGQIDGYTPSMITIKYPTNNSNVDYYVWVLDDSATGSGFTQIYS